MFCFSGLWIFNPPLDSCLSYFPLLFSFQVLGTPTREEIKCMNPNYTEFKFPQIKAHPWHKVVPAYFSWWLMLEISCMQFHFHFIFYTVWMLLSFARYSISKCLLKLWILSPGFYNTPQTYDALQLVYTIGYFNFLRAMPYPHWFFYMHCLALFPPKF